MTKYSQKIIDIINSSCTHLTAEDIFLRLKKTSPKIVLSSVYNNLNYLCTNNLIKKISLNGRSDFYDKMIKHDHLCCSSCGKIMDFQYKDLTKNIEKLLGDKITNYDLKIFYTCCECKKKNKKK